MRRLCYNAPDYADVGTYYAGLSARRRPAAAAYDGGSRPCGAAAAAGIVQCWGANGDADKGQADPPVGPFTAISAGYEHTCGIRPPCQSDEASDGQSGGHQSGGSIECWGDNAAGQSTPPAGSFTAVAAGRAHTCALSDAGTARCWGCNEYGQTAAPAGQFTALSAGGEHSCAIRPEGQAECWGDHHYGQSAALGRV